MELFLNLVWLTLSVAVLASWAMRLRKRCGVIRISAAKSFLVLACIMVFLFPVISMTDDVQFMVMCIESNGSALEISNSMKFDHAVAALPSASSIDLVRVYHAQWSRQNTDDGQAWVLPVAPAAFDRRPPPAV